jgi:hypothetical protein
MGKKNRPVEQAANSDIRTSDITPPIAHYKFLSAPQRNTVLASICFAMASMDGQKMIFCITATFHLDAIMRRSLSASLVFDWSESTKKHGRHWRTFALPIFLPWRRSQSDPVCEP